MKRLIAVILLLAVLIAGGAAWYAREGESKPPTYRTAAVERGELLITIGATGTVEPEEVIDVGAQVAGLILSFGTDAAGKTVDYGSTVTKGMVLARIDDAVYSAQATEADAQVKAARAGVLRAVADREQASAKLTQAAADWERAQKLGPSEALAQATFDGYKAAYETAKATLAVNEAGILEAQAQVTQAEAALTRANRNLAFCTITSPVDGVIIDRRVNIGQTVVASLNAPSLFLIAKDLRKMQVWTAVNEADIGKIHPGQAVTFTVDAFPGESFKGTVGKVRLNASMTQNVVTYTVEVLTDNSSGRLLPYLTANVQFEVMRRPDVLLVANAALRYTPQAQYVAPDAREVESANDGGRASEPRPHPTTRATSRPGTRPGGGVATHQGTLWVQDGRWVRPIAVRVGGTDNSRTEVRGEGVGDSMRVITGEIAAGSQAGDDARNPFVPRFRARRGSAASAGSNGGGSGGSSGGSGGGGH